MLCSICNKNFEGHFNSKCCSNECKKKNVRLIKKKYADKMRKIIKVENLNNEIWKDIKDFENLYQISNYGRVKSTQRRGGGGVLKEHISKQGYKYVILSKNNHLKKTFQIHRLIGLNFIDNPKNLPCIDHIDRDKQNNNINNLRWVSYKTNANNSKKVDLSSSLEITKEFNKKYNKFYIGYRANVNKKSKRSKSLVKCVCWIFENNKYLMNHLTHHQRQ